MDEPDQLVGSPRPRTSALAGRPHLQLGELREQSWVDNDVTRGPCRQVVLDACSSAGFSPAFRVETQDYPSAIRFVGEGVGITVVPQLGLVDLPTSVVAVPITNPTPQRSISVHVRDAVAGHPAVRRIRELLEDRGQTSLFGPFGLRSLGIPPRTRAADPVDAAA